MYRLVVYIFYYVLLLLSAVGQLNSAAEAAATFLAMEPSNEVMTSNVRYYSTTHGVSADPEAVRLVTCALVHAMGLVTNVSAVQWKHWVTLCILI